MLRSFLLFAPHEESAFRPPRRERIERRLVRAFVEKFGQRFFFRTAHCTLRD